jgi:hypothetical protein
LGAKGNAWKADYEVFSPSSVRISEAIWVVVGVPVSIEVPAID